MELLVFKLADDGALRTERYADVFILYDATHPVSPFECHVGEHLFRFQRMRDAVHWCSEMAHDRALFAMKDK